MAKKRRVRSTVPAPARTAPAPAREIPVSASPAPARRPASSLANYDYSYVRRDLRRIGVLAALLFSGQIILAFLLPHLLR